MPKLTPISNKEFAAYSMQNAKGIDIIVKDLQTKFNNTFAWLEKGFGRAVKVGSIRGDEEQIIAPYVFVENDGDYQNVLTLDNYDAYCFFYAEDPEGTLDYNPIVDNQLERTLHIIFWFKQSKVNTNATEPIIERVKQDIRKAIGDVRLSCDNSILDVTAYDEPDEIFNPLGFTFDFIQTQNLNNDYAALRFELEVQFYHNSDSYNTTELIQSLTYSNNYQEISSSFTSMSPTLLPTNATGTYTADSLPDGLALDANTGIISEDDYASIPNGLSSFTITFTGSDSYSGTATYFVVLCKVVASSNTVDGLTYDNDDQTIWQASGSVGVFVDISPTVDPCDATGTYSSGDLPSGLSLNSSTGIISIDTYGDVPIGESTFTVTFTGSGSFTGSADYIVTVIKRELAELDDIDGITINGWWDVSDSGTITESGDLISQVNGRHSGGENATQATANNQPVKSTLNGNRCALFTGSSYLEVTLSSEINQSFSIFISGLAYIGPGNAYWIGGTTDPGNRRIWHDINKRINVYWGVNNIVSLTTDEVINFFDNLGTVTEFLFNGSSSKITIDGGETIDQTINTTNSLSQGFYIGSYGVSPNGFSGKMVEIAIVSGIDSSTKRQLIEGAMAWKAGTQSKLNDSHPYKNNPPFKPLP